MVRDLPNVDIPIPRSDWTVGEAAAHLAFTTLGLAMMARGLAIPYGDGTREGLAEANLYSLEGFTERDPVTLANQIVAETRMVFDEAAVQPPDRMCPTPMGVLPVAGVGAYVIVHHSMHGSAISTALGAPWPFDPEHIPHMWPFLQLVLPRLVDPIAAAGLTACFEVRFGEVFAMAGMFDEGELTMARTPSRPPDCVVSGDAQTLFLVLVKVQTMQEAVAAGDITLSGPNPDLGLSLPDFFNVP